MERLSERSNGESIKSTMLKHEEIFKQQVRELHRLYHVQTTLMTRAKCEKTKKSSFIVSSSGPHIATEATNKLQNSRSSSETTHSSQASIRISHSKNTTALSLLSLPLRNSKGYIFQNSVEGESPESCSNDDCNLDLSLSIGCASDKMKGSEWKEVKSVSNQLLSSNLNREDNGQDCSNSSSGFGAESLKRPHWLCKALSLNRT